MKYVKIGRAYGTTKGARGEHDKDRHLYCARCAICIGRDFIEQAVFMVKGRKVCGWCKSKLVKVEVSE